MAGLCLFYTPLLLIPLAQGQGHGNGDGVPPKVNHALQTLFLSVLFQGRLVLVKSFSSSKRERKQGAANSNPSHYRGTSRRKLLSRELRFTCYNRSVQRLRSDKTSGLMPSYSQYGLLLRTKMLPNISVVWECDLVTIR